MLKHTNKELLFYFVFLLVIFILVSFEIKVSKKTEPNLQKYIINIYFHIKLFSSDIILKS